MTELLLRIFVPASREAKNPQTHAAIGKLAGMISILCNLLLSIIKFILGLATGSVSITADALNNTSDVASSLITYLGFRFAQHPADSEHPFGHARIEYISAMVISVLVLMIGFEMAKSSIAEIISPTTQKIETAALCVLFLSIGVKLWMYLVNRSLGKKIKSATLFAAATDCRNDVLATSAVLLGCMIQHLWNINIDGYAGLAVALFILYSGVKLSKEALAPLLGKSADADLVEQIHQIILSHEQVLGIHDLLLHDYGPGQCYASVHAELSADENPLVCHDILDDIEWDVAQQLNVQLVIHYDPVVVNDSEWNRLKTHVSAILFSLNPAFSMHDFRLVKGSEKTKLVFDLMVPYAMCGQHKKLKENIDEALKNAGICYPTVIRFEGKI